MPLAEPEDDIIEEADVVQDQFEVHVGDQVMMVTEQLDIKIVRNTPQKARFDTTWTGQVGDDLKLKLLEHYLDFAKDPLGVSIGTGSKIKHVAEQMSLIRDMQVDYKGQQVAWKEIARENYMAEIFCKKGFEGQNYKKAASLSTGLYQLLADFVGSSDPDVIKAVKEEFLADVRRRFF